MLNPQEWLEQTYPKNSTIEIEFDLNTFNLGELTIADYPNLKIIWTTENRKINNLTKLSINNCPQLVRINIVDWVDNQELNINNCPNLTMLDCSNNKLTELDLTNCLNLTQLDCRDNQLTKLSLSSCLNLTTLHCWNNNLTKLDVSNCSSLTTLHCWNNKLTNLKFVQNLTKLELLNITENNITIGLQYLPLSLKEFECDGEIWKELARYGKNLRVWQQTYPELMDDNLSLINLQLNGGDNIPLVITATPKELLEEIREAKPIINYTLPNNFSYPEFALRDNHPLVWERKNQEKATSLPLRLYNFETRQVVTTANENDIPHYFALSYVWGTDWEKAPQNYGQGFETDLTKLGRKALNKAIATWELIKQDSATPINHIWIDNFCIDQKNTKKNEKGQTEKAREVTKQKQYYNDATATLVAIDSKIGWIPYQQNELELAQVIIIQIVSSPWFTRAWTFQEGLLSKQTIFMFDDGLVDGRELAKIWAGVQDNIALNHATIFITPFGWSYGATNDQVVQLSLSQALDAVKHRQQTVALDGLYSILGLLPYGKKVTVSYENNTSEQTLQELMGLAVKENPYAAISWLGERRNDKLWPIPKINEDGSTNVEGFVNITAQLQSLKITEQGICLVGSTDNNVNKEYIIIVPNDKQIVSDKPFEILVPKKEYSRLPIKLAESNYSSTSNDKIFIDLLNKQIIAGEKAIEQYQAQIEINPNSCKII